MKTEINGANLLSGAEIDWEIRTCVCDVSVKWAWVFRFRVWLGVKFLRLAGWIMGLGKTNIRID